MSISTESNSTSNTASTTPAQSWTEFVKKKGTDFIEGGYNSTKKFLEEKGSALLSSDTVKNIENFATTSWNTTSETVTKWGHDFEKLSKDKFGESVTKIFMIVIYSSPYVLGYFVLPTSLIGLGILAYATVRFIDPKMFSAETHQRLADGAGCSFACDALYLLARYILWMNPVSAVGAVIAGGFSTFCFMNRSQTQAPTTNASADSSTSGTITTPSVGSSASTSTQTITSQSTGSLLSSSSTSQPSSSTASCGTSSSSITSSSTPVVQSQSSVASITTATCDSTNSNTAKTAINDSFPLQNKPVEPQQPHIKPSAAQIQNEQNAALAKKQTVQEEAPVSRRHKSRSKSPELPNKDLVTLNAPNQHHMETRSRSRSPELPNRNLVTGVATAVVDPAKNSKKRSRENPSPSTRTRILQAPNPLNTPATSIRPVSDNTNGGQA